MSTYTILPKDDSNLDIGISGDDGSQVVVVDTATQQVTVTENVVTVNVCLLYTSPSPRDRSLSRMPSSA